MTEALLGSPYMDLIFSIMRARRRKKKEVGKRLIRTHPYFPLPASRAHENLVFGKASAIWGNPLRRIPLFTCPEEQNDSLLCWPSHRLITLSWPYLLNLGLWFLLPWSVISGTDFLYRRLKSCLLRTPPFFEYPDETIRDRNEYTLFRGKESLTYLNRRSKIEMDPTITLDEIPEQEQRKKIPFDF